ncbi:MAG: hypothetical protein QM755_11945 [Luteolibacter sp.]
MEIDTSCTPPPAAEEKLRSYFRPAVTTGIFIGCYLMIAVTTCGCHFRASALFPTFLPLAWSLYLLFTAVGWKAKTLAWIVFLLAVFWVAVGFFSNIVFLFR